MKRAVCFFCVCCSLTCMGMNSESWRRYDENCVLDVGTVVSGTPLVSEEAFDHWYHDVVSQIGKMGGEEGPFSLTQMLMKEARDVRLDFMCIQQHGMSWSRFEKLINFVSVLRPQDNTSLDEKILSLRQAVEPGLLTLVGAVISSAVSYVLPENPAWSDLDKLLNNVDKARDCANLLERINKFETYMRRLKSDKEEEKKLLSFSDGMRGHLQLQASLISRTLQENLQKLPEPARQALAENVCEKISQSGDEKAVMVVQKLLSGVAVEIPEVSQREYQNLSLALSSLVLCVNGELAKLLAEGKSVEMVEGVEKFDGGYRLIGSNVLCSRSFLRGGWIKLLLDGGALEIKFAQADDYKWFVNSVEVANLPFLSNAELSSPGTIFSVFGNTEWGVIHSDPSFSLEKALNIGFLSLCAEGEGDRVYNVSIVKRNDGEPFMFVGDLISSDNLARNDHFSVDYFSATIDTGTFVNSKKLIQATPGMNFGKACIGFIKGTLEGQVTPRKLKYAIKQNSPISIDGTESAEIPTEEAQ